MNGERYNRWNNVDIRHWKETVGTPKESNKGKQEERIKHQLQESRMYCGEIKKKNKQTSKKQLNMGITDWRYQNETYEKH